MCVGGPWRGQAAETVPGQRLPRTHSGTHTCRRGRSRRVPSAGCAGPGGGQGEAEAGLGPLPCSGGTGGAAGTPEPRRGHLSGWAAWLSDSLGTWEVVPSADRLQREEEGLTHTGGGRLSAREEAVARAMTADAVPDTSGRPQAGQPLGRRGPPGYVCLSRRLVGKTQAQACLRLLGAPLLGAQVGPHFGASSTGTTLLRAPGSGIT